MPEIAIVLGVLFYGFIGFVVWKFYQVLSRIDENLQGIGQAIGGLKEAVERSGRPESKPE